MRATSTRRRAFMTSASLGGPLFVILAATNCYAPTEVTLALSTDLDCAEDPRTRIYKGEPGRYESAPETEVTTCTPGSPDAQIGTLVVIPSSGTDGSAAVKIVLARNGKAPADCESEPTNCIFATRSFSFSAHASRRLPIRLLRDCLGTKCADGETCIAGGKCVPNRVECLNDDCVLPGEPPPPPPLPDGGRPGDGGPSPLVDGDVPPDAMPDGTVDSGDEDVFVPVPACVPSSGVDIVATNSKIPALTATGTNHHFWIDDRMPVEAHVMQVTKKGPGSTPILDLAPNIDIPFALGVGGDTALVAFGDNVSSAMVWNGDTYTAPSGMKRVSAIASSAQGRIAVAGVTNGVQERTSVALFRQLLAATASSLVAADDYYFAATASGITRIDPVPSTPATTPITGAPGNAILSVSGEVVYAAAKEAGSTWGIWRIASNTTSASLVIGGRGVMSSLASDGTYVYWTENNEIWRTTTSSGVNAPQKIFALVGMAVDHVTADAECLYFWTRRSGEPAALRLGPRKPFSSVGPGP
jgi:hypothetical protein